jgi:hypothetical protein
MRASESDLPGLASCPEAIRERITGKLEAIDMPGKSSGRDCPNVLM